MTSDVPVRVEQILVDPELGTTVLILKEGAGNRRLPIWIGQPEALAIAAALKDVELPRPLTHDLLSSVITELGAVVRWVRVHDVSEGTFYASVALDGPRGKVDVDSRPSDGIALALRVGAPILVADHLFAEAAPVAHMQPVFTSEIEDEEFLANLPDEIFGKYKM